MEVWRSLNKDYCNPYSAAAWVNVVGVLTKVPNHQTMVLDQNFSPIIYTKLHHFGPGGNAISNGGAGSGNGSGYESDEGEPNGRCSPLLQQMQAKYLLPIPQFHDSHKKCMVIDLDETLVHSSFKVNSFVLFCLFFFSNFNNSLLWSLFEGTRE